MHCKVLDIKAFFSNFLGMASIEVSYDDEGVSRAADA